jgi:hypothetical protein
MPEKLQSFLIMFPRTRQSIIAENDLRPCGLIYRVFPPPAADETVDKLKGQAFFQKDALKLTCNVLLDVTLWHRDFEVVVIDPMPHVLRQMTVKALTEVVGLFPFQRSECSHGIALSLFIGGD